MPKPKKIIRVFVKSDPDVNEYIRCTNVGITLQGVKRNIYAVHGLIEKTILKRYVKFKDYPIDDIACEVYQLDFELDVETIRR